LKYALSVPMIARPFLEGFDPSASKGLTEPSSF